MHSDVKVWKCEFPGCLISYKAKRNLMKHEVTHETNLGAQKSYRCEFNNCGPRFTNKSNLKVHIAAKHNPKNARPFQCSFCTKSFWSQNVLRTHIQTHVKELRLSCGYCGFSTYNEPSLGNHVRKLHEKAVKYSCTFSGCELSTAYSNSWADHARLHEPDIQGRRPFPCSFPDCDFRGSSQGNLNQHIRARHDKDRP